METRSEEPEWVQGNQVEEVVVAPAHLERMWKEVYVGAGLDSTH